MKLEVLLSVMSFDIKNLDKMNIKYPCIVIDQCDKEGTKKYKNFNIYYSKERGSARSRNKGLELVTADIIVLADDDIIYNKNFEEEVIKEFKNNPKADMIIFNVDNPYRNKRVFKKRKKIHFYNSLNYAFYQLAFRRSSVKNIKVNTLLGAGSIYNGGDDSNFIVDCLKNKLNIYSSTVNIGRITGDNSTWFKGYNKKYFFDKGAIYTAISYRLRHFLMLQHLLRHRNEWKEIKFFNAYKYMLDGSKDYIKRVK